MHINIPYFYVHEDMYYISSFKIGVATHTLDQSCVTVFSFFVKILKHMYYMYLNSQIFIIKIWYVSTRARHL